MAKQTKIKSIHVENVRGISSKTFIFETPEMIGNKFHILVAPNGFGKSSLAGALGSLKPRSLKLPESLHHKEDESNKPKLEITYIVDGIELTLKADESSNEISKVFSISVITAKLKPRAVAKTGFSQFAKPTASLIIEPVVLVESVPKRPDKEFKTSKFKKHFGNVGKVFPNIEKYLKNDHLLTAILSLPNIGKFTQKAVWKVIDAINKEINSQNTTAEKLREWIELNKLTDIRVIPELAAIAELLADFAELNEIDRFMLAYQFGRIFATEAKLFKQHRDWITYVNGKRRCTELMASVNSNPDWINVSIKETKGQLVAEFPVATKMSNGQRDLLSFVAQLLKAEFELNGPYAILVVDELFDYLDECNLLAAQFYASRFIERFRVNGAEIFPLFLTHLDPEVFKHSILGLGSKDTRKVHLLDKASDSSRKVGIAAMVKLREEAGLKLFIGKYFFHYHPQPCDQVALFQAKGLKAKWGRSHDFYTYVFEEFSKYVASEPEVDFVAACVGARIAIEKHAFDQLSEAEQQRRFTEEFNKRTTDKLDFVEEVGGKVPLSHRLLGLLYNDVLHHKEHFDYISAIVSKMKNSAIRGMMSEISIPDSF